MLLDTPEPADNASLAALMEEPLAAPGRSAAPGQAGRKATS